MSFSQYHNVALYIIVDMHEVAVVLSPGHRGVWSGVRLEVAGCAVNSPTY